MSPQDFVQKWSPSTLRERQGSQEHFIDLCRVLDERTPAEEDPTGKWYCFDAGAEKTIGTDGFADVWKKGYFAWEYKGKHLNLTKAYAQLQQYASSLENPPLLIVSDMDTIIVHTNFTNTIHEVHRITLQELLLTEKRELLKWAFSEPDRLRPGMTRQELTEKAAAQFAGVAKRLRDRQHDPQRVAHFMNKMLFCMFAEDIGLLRSTEFSRLLEMASRKPQLFTELAKDLFSAMRTGGRIGLDEIDWFNGGLFDDDDALALEKAEIDQILEVSQLDWGSIEPSIFGTLFERGLDPDKRSQLGAHYTDSESIMRIVEPVVIAPLRAEWEAIRSDLIGQMERYDKVRSEGQAQHDVPLDRPLSRDEILALRAELRKANVSAAARKILRHARDQVAEFLKRLASFRVLDPACGSGNFLYLALLGLKDLEHQIITEVQELGLPRFFPAVGPEAVLGIEVNTYAAELARVTIWIGQIQWMLRHGWGLAKSPILQPLDQISSRDAILDPDGTEAQWPEADCIIGNPPFLGDRQHLSVLGEDYTDQLRKAYKGRVPARADLVVYWVMKAAEKTINNQVRGFGLVATKSIAKGASRVPLDLLTSEGRELIYDAWTNEPWVVEGAAVRVSIVCAASPNRRAVVKTRLNGQPVERINPDLTSGTDTTKAKRLSENAGIGFQGVKLTGPFDISGREARELLLKPLNPNGRSNADVIARLFDIDDIVGRDSDRWVVDFGTGRSEAVAALYEEPFRIIDERVLPFRNDPQKCRSKEKRLTAKYWEFQRPRPEMRAAISEKFRFIVTPETSEHRVFVFVPGKVLIQGSLFCFAREDYVTFGILSSRFHEIWATAQGNRLGVGNQRRYNKDFAFETFPFPEKLTPNRWVQYTTDLHGQEIASAAQRLDELRERWLNPADLVRRETEVVPGYPERVLPLDERAEEELKKRTLTELYNERPAWLDQAHRRVDEAVAGAYGWPPDLPEGEVLEKLLELNMSRSEESESNQRFIPLEEER